MGNAFKRLRLYSFSGLFSILRLFLCFGSGLQQEKLLASFKHLSSIDFTGSRAILLGGIPFLLCPVLLPGFGEEALGYQGDDASPYFQLTLPFSISSQQSLCGV